MSSIRDSHRIVIAGASSLLGAELKSLLEESRFAASDFCLLDEEVAAGTLTEAGRAGIEELESQTSHLLSFQSIGKPVIDTQVAFTMLDRFGSESSQRLPAVRDRVRAEIRAVLAGSGIAPAVQILHAPVFYGSAFSACAQLDNSADQAAMIGACKRA